MTTALDISTQNDAPPLTQPEVDEHTWQSIEEAEAILEAMAKSLAPGSSDLQELASALFERKKPSETEETEAFSPTEQALRKAQARYQALVEQIPAITFMAPLDGTVSELYVSPQIEDMLGFTAEEWLNNPILWYQQLHPEDQNRWQEMFARTLNAGEHFKADYRFISREGQTVWIHGEAKVISDENGVPLFLQGVAFDITEQKSAEEKLQKKNVELAKARDQAMEASRAKSAFLANMSHELRTPLHAILGFSEMLQEDAEDAGLETFLPDLQKISSSAQHLVGLISNILDLSKIEAGKMDLFLESFDLDEMIQDLVATVTPLALENGNKIHTELPEPLGTIHADMTKVRQILLNLLSNACKFTQQGEIRIHGELAEHPEGGRIRIYVTDTGVGITPEQKNKLFQAFSQGDDSTTRKYGGTGLGLAISRRFCQIMGGSIELDSTPGKGSTFSVDLPIEVPELEEETWIPPVEESGLLTEKNDNVEARPSLLLYETQEAATDLFKTAFSSHPLDLHTASSADTLLRLAHDTPPAAILVNIGDPDGEGWKTLTAIRKDAGLEAIPVVPFAYNDQIDEGYILAATDHLLKPVEAGGIASLFEGLGASGRALIIEQEEAHRGRLTNLIHQHGWETVEALDGWSALQSIASDSPDLIVLNLLMSDMDGFEFIRLLRKTDAGRSIPVVTFSSHQLSEEDRERLIAGSQKALESSALSSAELLAETELQITKHVEKAEKKSVGGFEAPSLENHVLHHLQSQVAQLQAERDAAIKKLQSLHGSENGHGVSTEGSGSVQDADQLRQQLREQQQTVALLRSELEEAEREQSEVQTLRNELNASRAERDLAVSEAKELQAAREELTQARAERDAILAQLEQQAKQREHNDQQQKEVMQTIQLLQQEMAELRDEKRAQEKKRKLKRRKAKALAEKEPEPPAPPEPQQQQKPKLPYDEPTPAPSARAPSEKPAIRSQVARQPGGTPKKWYLIYQDANGAPQSTTASTEEIKSWLGKGEHHQVTELYVSPTPNGPFEPLRYYPELTDGEDILVPTNASMNLSDPATEAWDDESGWQKESTPPLPAGEQNNLQKMKEWLVWLVPIVVGVGTALLVKNLWVN